MVWIVIIVFAIVSLVLLSGHGSGLIAGYNTLNEAEKNKYNKKRICRVMGIVILDVIGMAIFTNIYGKIK